MSAAPARNDTCNCGSGEKWKRCCGSVARRQQIEREDAAAREAQHRATMERARWRATSALALSLAAAVAP